MKSVLENETHKIHWNFDKKTISKLISYSPQMRL